MNSRISYAEIVGIPQTDTWSQIFFLEKKDEFKNKGKLFYLISLCNKTDEDTAFLGKILAEQFSQNYFSSSQKPLESLTDSLKIVSETARERKIQKIEIAAAVILGNVLYVVRLSNPSVFFYRNNRFVSFFDKDSNSSSVSGYLQESDLLILASDGFLKLAGKEIIEKLLDHNSPQEIVSGLAPIILGSPINSDSSCLVIRWEGLVQEDSEERDTLEEEIVLEKEREEKKRTETKKTFMNGKILLVAKQILLLGHKTMSKILPKDRRQKTALSLILILVLVLTISVVLNSKKREELLFKKEFETAYESAVIKYEEGKAIVGLNNTQARAYLNTAGSIISEQLGRIKNHKSEEYVKASTIQKQIENSLSEISGINMITDPDVFFDLGLIKDGVFADRISLYKNKLAVFNQKNQAVYLIDIKTKSPKILAAGDVLSGAKMVTQGINTYLYSENNNILEINNESGKTRVISTKNDSLNDVSGMAAFAGNIYFLTKKDILKMIPTESGFSEPKSYLAKDLNLDFTKAVDMTIDGYVWVLYEDGLVNKFGQGRTISFSLSGLDKKPSKAKKFFVSDETKNSYLLDVGNKRIIVLNKNGAYQLQYVWEEINQNTDIVVSEEIKKILVLNGSKIYSFDLK